MNVRSRHGFTLIEVVTYCMLLIVIVHLGYGAYFQASKSANDLQRNAEDIVRVMRTGERWRADIRAAIAPPQLGEGSSLVISQAQAVVIYSLAYGQVWRQAGKLKTPLLSAVKSSTMEKDIRQRVTAWRWEMELASKNKEPGVRPLFTFEAVAPVTE